MIPLSRSRGTKRSTFWRESCAEFAMNTVPSMKGPAPVFPANYGYNLPEVYAVWIGVVVLMYPACLWFARLKERKQAWWLSYV